MEDIVIKVKTFSEWKESLKHLYEKIKAKKKSEIKHASTSFFTDRVEQEAILTEPEDMWKLDIDSINEPFVDARLKPKT